MADVIFFKHPNGFHGMESKVNKSQWIISPWNQSIMDIIVNCWIHVSTLIEVPTVELSLNVRTCNFLCKRRRCYHRASQRHEIEYNFKLYPIRALVNYEIPWIRLINWIFLPLLCLSVAGYQDFVEHYIIVSQGSDYKPVFYVIA